MNRGLDKGIKNKKYTLTKNKRMEENVEQRINNEGYRKKHEE